jgi:hypothetical protein
MTLRIRRGISMTAAVVMFGALLLIVVVNAWCTRCTTTKRVCPVTQAPHRRFLSQTWTAPSRSRRRCAANRRRAVDGAFACGEAPRRIVGTRSQCCALASSHNTQRGADAAGGPC